MDDGACAHLTGLSVPSLALPSTSGEAVDLSALDGLTVVFIYPRTAEAGAEIASEWKQTPGAFGCSAESCSFRDNHSNLRDLGVTHLFGLSTQDSSYQQEMAERFKLDYAVLSDHALAFTQALNLPTFEYNGMTLLKRVTLAIEGGKISRTLYPVFPPDKAPEQVLAWLRTRKPKST